jgi:O-methyltransferase
MLGKAMLGKALKRLGLQRYQPIPSTPLPIDNQQQDLDEEFVGLLEQISGPKDLSLYSTYQGVKYVTQNNIAGDFIECGVQEGRQIQMVALTLKKQGVTDRKIYLYDTFAGMTKPGKHDRKMRADKETSSAEGTMATWSRSIRDDHNEWAYCAIEDVKENVLGTGYPEENFVFVKGDVLETVPNHRPSAISFLRLDTDWYESSLHELVHLYDLVVNGGVIIFDDYWGMAGQRKAVDEFFQSREHFPLLHRTLYRERVMIKLNDLSV